MTTESIRAEFEAWAASPAYIFLDIERATPDMNYVPEMDYADIRTELCWLAYQAGRAANSPEIPDGWALVPIEPTREMLEQIKFLNGITDQAMTVRYKAMLAAVRGGDAEVTP